VNFHLEGGKYEGLDLSTTPRYERWRSLRTLFRGPDGKDQIKYDRFPWKLDQSTGKSCTFSYEDEDVRVEKTIAAGDHPFELHVTTSVKNLAKEPKKHQLSIATFAFRTHADMKGGFGRQSPQLTELSCAGGKDVVRKKADDFKSGWFAVPKIDRYAAINTQY